MQNGKQTQKPKIKNKVGYCENKDLQGLQHLKGGHYVYIRKVNKNGTCDVNIITSLENKDHKFDFEKLKQVKKGNTYAIPKYDANFSRWSGVNKMPVKDVKVSKIKDIGKKKIKKRHNFFIGKFMN